MEERQEKFTEYDIDKFFAQVRPFIKAIVEETIKVMHKENLLSEQFLTVEEVAKMFRLSPKTVYINKEKLGVKYFMGEKPLFRLSYLVSLLKNEKPKKAVYNFQKKKGKDNVKNLTEGERVNDENVQEIGHDKDDEVK